MAADDSLDSDVTANSGGSVHYSARQSLSCAQARNVDYYAIQHLGYSGLVLMENAGRGVADVLLRHWLRFAPARSPVVLIACSKGNNGGDGFVLARHLHLRNVPVEVLLACESDDLSGDAATNYTFLRQLPVPVHLWDSHGARQWLHGSRKTTANYIVDAILGTGASGAPRPPLDQLIEGLNRMSGTKIAIDLPSGLDGDSGQSHVPTFRADVTCTFVAPKPGLLVTEAQVDVGHLEVLDIGLPWSVVEKATTWEIKNAC